MDMLETRHSNCPQNKILYAIFAAENRSSLGGMVPRAYRKCQSSGMSPIIKYQYHGGFISI